MSSILKPYEFVSEKLKNRIIFYTSIAIAIASGAMLLKISNDTNNYIKEFGKKDVKKYYALTSDSLDTAFEKKFNVKLPNITTEYTSGLRGSMQYISQEKKIRVDTNSFFSGYSLKDQSFIAANFYNQATLNGGRFHENGHAITFEIISDLKKEGDFHPSFEDRSNNYRHLLLLEGIAEYCEIEMGEMKKRNLYMPDFESFDRFAEHNFREIYRIVSHFVYKIIDRFGLEEGIKRIFKNPVITNEQVKNIADYQNMILR